jgi:N-methylhydantoinase B
MMAFKALTTPDTPLNSGNFRPVEVLTTPGSLMHAVEPMPTFTIWPAILAPEVINKALAQGMPDIIPACSGGDVCSIMALGVDPETGAPWLEATNDGVGFGAHAGGDGSDGIMHLSEPGCRNNPIEVLETKAPMLIENYRYRVDSGGAGKHRGGVGIERTYRFLAPSSAIVINYKTKTRPWGIGEGRDGLNNTVVLYPGTDDAVEVGQSYTHFATGEAMSNVTGGGGGWGNPFERDVAAVAVDVQLGLVSAEGAARDYGVAIDPVTFVVDEAETNRLRSGSPS